MSFGFGKNQSFRQSLALHYTSLRKTAKQKEVGRVLADLGLSGSENERINVLSGGEQQRVAMARCILKPGKLVLADEPTGSLDKVLAEEVFKQILLMRDNYDKTIIVVTHDLTLAAQCDRIIKLS